jgi:hypothetical protein
MSDTLRVLTVRQPWAWAIVHGGKDVENRSRNIAGDYRGPVAIHAGLAGDPVSSWPSIVLDAMEMAFSGYTDGITRSLTAPRLGVVIGMVDLIGVHQAKFHASWARDLVAGWSPWAEKDVWHLLTANPRPLAEPIPARGRLGLWRPDDALAAAIWEQVR